VTASPDGHSRLIQEAPSVNVQGDAQRRLAMLADATDTLFASLTQSHVFSAVGSLAQRLLPADAHAVWCFETSLPAWRIAWRSNLSDAFVADIVDWPGAPSPQVPFAGPLAARDVMIEPLLRTREARYTAEGITSLLAAPLRLGDENHGTVVAYYRRPAEFTDTDLRIATAFANIASAALSVTRLFEAQSHTRAAAQLAEQRARFLASAAAALVSSLDYEAALRQVAQLAVPEIADWCSIDLVDEDGRVRRLAVAHADPHKVGLARMLDELYPQDPAANYGRTHVIRTCSSVLVSRITDEMIRSAARDERHLAILREVSPRAYICVPLVAQGRAIGALTLVSAESNREYTEADRRFVEDLASRAALAIENARAHEEARRANRVKDEFLATLSHELRTPLNAILGYTRMLRRGAVAPDRQGNALQVVERNAVALNQIVEDVLDVSRIVSGKIRLNVQPVALLPVVQDALATIAPAADAKGVRIDTAIDPAAGPVSGDPDRLHQVMWNLLSNAVKFTPLGGAVQVSVARSGTHVEIAVRDTGIGIAPEFLPHVFERFRQADSRFTRAHNGLGLGLAITRHLVELHGGAITAASDGDGAGATFCVRLPAGATHPETAPGPARPPARAALDAASGPVASLSGVHVMAVDDEPDALELISELLSSAGARVTPASSAAAALALLDEQRPDVIVTDVGMPDMDGHQFVAHLRQMRDPAMRDVPVATLTGYARSEDRVRALQSGAQLHLVKPVDPAALVAAVLALASGDHGPL
jgi:signal transduction histidine kinase/ActR/RegA family two-component response regulator